MIDLGSPADDIRFPTSTPGEWWGTEKAQPVGDGSSELDDVRGNLIMSYLARKKKRSTPLSMGDAVSAIGNALQTVTGAIGTAASVAADPYLGETVCHVQQLAEHEKTGRIVTVCKPTRDGLTGGVGLRKVVKPLRAYVYAEQNPWVYPVAVGVAVGVPFFLGYLMGKD